MTAKKGYIGVGMEGPIASWYARITLKDLGRHQLMAKHLAPKIPTGGRILEIAPGPGYFCIELAKLGKYRITGLDISKSFVAMARRNADAAGVQVDFRQGNASAMPFDARAFDFTFCQAAFKNFSQPVQAIAEMYRVLRPGGVAVISDLRCDASADDIEREVKGMHLSPVNEFMTRWSFRHLLLGRAYSTEKMKQFVQQTPFGDGRIELNGIGFMVWLERPS
jgi:ubiquinone/menaquinone biosynthesis C-methylase UbiE